MECARSERQGDVWPVGGHLPLCEHSRGMKTWPQKSDPKTEQRKQCCVHRKRHIRGCTRTGLSSDTLEMLCW